MRSPHGHGAGRVGAASLLLSLVLSATGIVPVVATGHLESERAAEAPPGERVIVIEPVDHVMLVGGKRRLDASICNADGSACKAVGRKARWKVRPGKGLELSPRRGPSALVEGRKPGEYTIIVKQGKVTGSTTVTINEPPQREAAGPGGDEQRLYIRPEMRLLQLGELAVFQGWGCTLGEGGRLGPNGVPDGLDDACVPVDVLEVLPPPDVPMDVLGPFDSVFGFAPTDFPAGIDGDLVFAGPQVVTQIGSTVVSAQVEDRPFPLAPPWTDVPDDTPASWPAPGSPALTAPTEAGGELLAGDLDDDGEVTMRDFWIWRNETYDMPMPLANPESLLDADGDGRIATQDGLWIQREAFLRSGRPTGDADRDGRLTGDDRDSAYATFLTGRYDAALDVNGDLVLDEADWNGLGYGADPMPTPPSGWSRDPLG